MISSYAFYENYYGHLITHLREILKLPRNKIYLAGDSTFDNKKWVSENKSKAINGYENILDPPEMVMDVSYFVNLLQKDYVCINAAQEEASIGEKNILTANDQFILENIKEEDILIVSIGGNDVVLKPSAQTILNFGLLLLMNTSESISQNPKEKLKFILNIFKEEQEKYIRKLISKRKPKKIIICGVYYPCEVKQ